MRGIQADGHAARRSLVLDCGPQAENGGVFDRGYWHCRVGNITAWMNDVLEVRLHSPSGYDLRLVAQLHDQFVIAYRLRQACESNPVGVECAGTVGNARINECRAEFVIRARRDHTGEQEAAICKEIDNVAV